MRRRQAHPQHAALGARLMRPRRASQPPAVPAGPARSTTGAAAHRSEDPPHDGGIAVAAHGVQRGVIIRPPRRHARPASRSRFGGLAFHDPDDVEGPHVRHDPPSPRARSGPRTAAHRPTGDSKGRIFPPMCAEQAVRIQIPDRGLALSGTAARPGRGIGLRHRLLWPAQGRQMEGVAHGPPGRTRLLPPPSPDRQRDRTSRARRIPRSTRRRGVPSCSVDASDSGRADAGRR
jgi:hypothetical protein